MSLAATQPLTPTQHQQLLQAARQARARAYAPYSRFAVGAALLDEQGRIHPGTNVENAAYPQGVCAEAGAISAMCLAGGRRIVALLVMGEVDDAVQTGAAVASDAPRALSTAQPMAQDPSRWVTPCGGCRQKIREFAAPHTPILLAAEAGVHTTLTLDQLLPYSFGPEHLSQSGAL